MTFVYVIDGAIVLSKAEALRRPLFRANVNIPVDPPPDMSRFIDYEIVHPFAIMVEPDEIHIEGEPYFEEKQ